MRRELFLSASLLAWPAYAQNPAVAQSYGPQGGGQSFLSLSSNGAIPIFWAPAYGSCTWAPSNDVSACVNLAVTAACSAGGGNILLPAGTFNYGTQTSISCSGVSLTSTGIGAPRDTVSPSSPLSPTHLIGTNAGGTMLDVEPTGTLSQYSNNIQGIWFDCNAVEATCVKFSQVSNSTIDIGVSEPTTGYGMEFLTQNISDNPGSQGNRISVRYRCVNPSYTPVCVYFDKTSGSSWNFSYNDLPLINGISNLGDGVVFGNTDNNTIGTLRGSVLTGGTGRAPVIFAADGYVMSNGGTVVGHSRDINVTGKTGTNVLIEGYDYGATFTAAGGNAGSMATTTVTATTNGTTSTGGTILALASVASVASGEFLNCGGYASGVLAGDPITSVTGSTALLFSPAIGPVASSTTCTLGWGFTSSGASGAYTLTSTNANTFTLTAPAGGTTQSGIAPTSGVLVFTDMAIPITGTASTGDSWTILAGTPPLRISLYDIDVDNAFQPPTTDWGATGQYRMDGQPQALPFGPAVGGIAMSRGTTSCSATGNNSVCLGNNTGSIGTGALSIGAGTNANGPNTFAHGHSSVVTTNSNYGEAGGDTTTVSASDSRTGGQYSNDRTRTTTDCWGGKPFSTTTGSDQSCQELFSKSLSGTSTQLTADQAAGGAGNLFNIVTAGVSYHGVISAKCVDTNGVLTRASWDPAYFDLINATGTLTYVGAYSSATTPTRSNGTPTGGTGMAAYTLQVTTDATNKGLVVTVASLLSTTDTLHCAAHIISLEEVQ